MVTCVVVTVAGAQSVGGGDARAKELIRELGLKVLPKESGYLGIVGVSDAKVRVQGQAKPSGQVLAAQSQNYYMLTRELPINYLHWLEPADTHVLIEGGPVDYFIYCKGKKAEKQVLGMDLKAGQRPIVAAPAGCWKALRLEDRASYALMANALSPEFTADRVRIGAGEEWVKEWTGSAPWATREFLKEMIGPNWVR